MLTLEQIEVGESRLNNSKLTELDIDKLVSVFRMFLADLESKYRYDLKSSLESLDDSLDYARKAAQVAGCLAILEDLGFGVASLQGDLNYKEKDEYFQYVIHAFSKIYPIPVEWSQYDLKRRALGSRRTSQTILTQRV